MTASPTMPAEIEAKKPRLLERLKTGARDVRFWLIAALCVPSGIATTILLHGSGEYVLRLIRELGAYAWPAVAVWGLLFFRSELAMLFHRIEQFYGAKFAPSQQPERPPQPLPQLDSALEQQSVTVIPDSLELKSAVSAPTVIVSPPTDVREKSFFDPTYPMAVRSFFDVEVQKLKLTGAGLATVSRADVEQALVAEIASSLLNGEHITTAYEIYGSQTKLLRRLLSTDRLSEREVSDFWVANRSSWKQPNENVELWLRYLVTRQLIQRLADGSVSITDRGRNFLEWATRHAAPLESKLS